MLDTMTSTKIVAALCGAMLFFLFGLWAAESIYHVESHNPGVVELVALEEVEDTEVEAEPVDITELLASADVTKGQRVFTKCQACHKLEDGQNSVGPHLFQIIDRPVGAVSDFKYSSSMAEFEGNWTVQQLSDFLVNPKKYVPGTKMVFAGLKKDNDRANLIAYLIESSQ